MEREDELIRLERALDGALAGDGEMVAIAGPAGIGKSSLLAAARRAAHERGIRVLAASGSELERTLPFGICRQLFEPALATASDGERQALLDGAAAIARRFVLGAPGSVEAADDTRERGEVEPRPADAYAPLHGLYWLAANLAEQAPLLISVDDCHWADAASLRWLGYLARRLDGLPAAAVLATRETEPRGDDSLRQVLAAPEVDVCRPGALSAAASAAVIAQALGAEPGDEFAAACQRATRGNPFYLRELLRTLATAGMAPTAPSAPHVAGVGPPAISREVLGRVAHLAPGCAALVRTLAVLGGRAGLGLTAELARLQEDAAAAAANALARAGVLDPSLPLRFSHPIIQAAVYEDIPPLERAGTHRRAAELLADRSAGASEVAAHLLRTEPGRDPWTRARLVEAAELALAEGASQTAVECLRRALAESPPPHERSELSLRLGSALVADGEPAGIELLRAACQNTPDPSGMARAAILLASAVVFFERSMDEAVGVLESARTELGSANGGGGVLATQLESMLYVLGITVLDARRRLRERLGEAAKRAHQAPDEVAAPLLPPLAIELAFAGGAADNVAMLAERALRASEVVQAGPAYSPLPFVAAYALISTGRARAAERAFDDALDRATREGAVSGFTAASAGRSFARLRRGDLLGAQADAQACVRLAAEPSPEVFVPVALATLVNAHLERGELEQARCALALIPGGAFDPDGILTQPLVESRARLRFAEGDYAGGLQELRRGCEWADAWCEGSGSWPVQWRAALALGELRAGNAGRALDLAREDVELARRFGAPRALGLALVALGLSEGGKRGIDHLREGAAELGRSEDRLEHARALVELGAALRRAGERNAAREPLAAGMTQGRGCGAAVLAERAYEELRAAGARPQKILHSGVEALTPSELRVARMAAEGMTNKAIAQALFVTRKTVEVHLSHTYQKLDIASRSELPSKLAADAVQPR